MHKFDWQVTVNLRDGETYELNFPHMTADDVMALIRDAYPTASSVVMVTTF